MLKRIIFLIPSCVVLMLAGCTTVEKDMEIQALRERVSFLEDRVKQSQSRITELTDTSSRIGREKQELLNIIVQQDEQILDLSRGLKEKKKEYFLAVLLDTRNQLIKTAEISIGSLDSSIVHPREVFKEAISASAAAVIFVHNHPSGDTEASEDDIRLTKRLAEAGEIVGIDVLDHVIIGGKVFRSLKREGLF